MNLALDFDETFTRAPVLWCRFIQAAVMEGHQVYIVTARDRDNDGINWSVLGMNDPPAPMIWCDGMPKEIVVKERGIEIDVWIDDNPRGILDPRRPIGFMNAGQLLEWRKTDKYRDALYDMTGESSGTKWREDHAANRPQEA